MTLGLFDRVLAQFRDGPPVNAGPDDIAGSYTAWAEQRGATLVHRNVDDEYLLHVYAYEEDGLIWLSQGGDIIGVPFEEFGQFVSALEGLYAS